VETVTIRPSRNQYFHRGLLIVITDEQSHDCVPAPRSNQIRGLLLERGITLRKGRRHVDAALPEILADTTVGLSGCLRAPLSQLKLELDQLAPRITEADCALARTSRENEACQRLIAIPGIGPVTATALITAIGNGAAFRKGREFSAWVGMVPKEHSSSGFSE